MTFPNRDLKLLHNLKYIQPKKIRYFKKTKRTYEELAPLEEMTCQLIYLRAHKSRSIYLCGLRKNSSCEGCGWYIKNKNAEKKRNEKRVEK